LRFLYLIFLFFVHYHMTMYKESFFSPSNFLTTWSVSWKMKNEQEFASCYLAYLLLSSQVKTYFVMVLVLKLRSNYIMRNTIFPLVSQVPIWQGERTRISSCSSDCPKELNQNGMSNLSRLKDNSLGDSVNMFNQ